MSELLEFINLIRTEISKKKHWYMLQSCLRKGRFIYYSDNLIERAMLNVNSKDSKIIPKYPQSLYEFVYENEIFIKQILELEGLVLKKFSHNLYNLPDFKYVYYAQKLDDLEENKFIYEYNTITPLHSFVLGLVLLKTNMGKILISKNDFVEKFIQNPEDFCYRDIDQKKLAKLFDIKLLEKSNTSLTIYREKLFSLIKDLINNDFLDEFQSAVGEELITLSPAAFIWKNMINEYIKKEENYD